MCGAQTVLYDQCLFFSFSVDPYRNPEGAGDRPDTLTEILDPIEIKLPSKGLNPDALLNLVMEKYIRKLTPDMYVVKGAAHYIT